MKRLTCLAAGAAAMLATASAADWRIVHAGALLAEPGSAPTERQSIVIRDGRIERIAGSYLAADALATGPGDTVAIDDLSDKFVLPGLIDLHTHITFEMGPRSKLEAVELSDARMALKGAHYGMKTLTAGFTTIRNVGGPPSTLALRDAINDGDVPGPRLFVVGGAISATGGHADIHGYRAEVLEALGNPNVCDGAADCRRAVRALVRAGADVIKITPTGGVLSETGAGLNQQMFDDELVAIVETAHSMGRKVAAHAHGTNGINAALRAGVDTIEHGTFLDRESIRLFKRADAYLVPTLLAPAMMEPLLADENSFLPPPQREKGRIAVKRARQYAREAHDAGVKIAFGTDAGVFPHGLNGKEFALLVEWGGLTPMEAIASATVVAAEALGQADKLGAIAPGKFADIIAVDGDPLANITELEDVDFVMKNGVVYKP